MIRCATKNFLKYLTLDNDLVMPRYRQLINAIIADIEKRELVTGDQLPSIQEVCITLGISKNVVEKAYNGLKKSGFITAVHGKGYFITQDRSDTPRKVLLLFNKLGFQRKVIYDAFISTVGQQTIVDFYIYNNDFEIFRKLLLEKHEKYDKVVVMPHFLAHKGCPAELLNSIPKEKLVLVDKMLAGLKGEFSAIYEDFEQDIYHALEKLLDRLVLYPVLILVFPFCAHFAEGIIKGFEGFCRLYGFDFRIIPSINECRLKKGQVYLLLQEEDLVNIIEKISAGKWKVGKDIGLISYNETPLKKVLLAGITTISSDFDLMGRLAGNCVVNDDVMHIAVPCSVRLRKSL